MAAPLPITPRGLSHEIAAIYTGIKADKFDQLVRSGQMPAPKTIAGTVVWDRFEVDLAFNAIGTRTMAETLPIADKIVEPSKPPHVPNAFSPKTLAQRWLCSERTIRDMITRGELPFLRLGGSLIRIR